MSAKKMNPHCDPELLAELRSESPTQKRFKKLLDEVPETTRVYVGLLGDISVAVNKYLEENPHLTPKILAKKLNWKLSVVHRVLHGDYNLTIKELSELIVIVKCDFIKILYGSNIHS